MSLSTRIEKSESKLAGDGTALADLAKSREMHTAIRTMMPGIFEIAEAEKTRDRALWESASFV
jgi:hypothetical protein